MNVLDVSYNHIYFHPCVHSSIGQCGGLLPRCACSTLHLPVELFRVCDEERASEGLAALSLAIMAEHLASNFGTEKDRVNCPFYFKIGVCRHGDRCSRLHNRPTASQTLLLANMYQSPDAGFHGGVDQHGNIQQSDPRKLQEHFEVGCFVFVVFTVSNKFLACLSVFCWKGRHTRVFRLSRRLRHLLASI